jgi:hypothetical protein
MPGIVIGQKCGSVATALNGIANRGNIGECEIWLMGLKGERARKARKLYETDDNSSFELVVWSPDSRRLAYIKNHRALDRVATSSEKRDLFGGPPESIYSPAPRAFYWVPDGRMILLLARPDPNTLHCNLWEPPIDIRNGETSRQP